MNLHSSTPDRRATPLCRLAARLLLFSLCLGPCCLLAQEDITAPTASIAWKQAKLVELERQLSVTEPSAGQREWLAQQGWLTKWTPAGLSDLPSHTEQVSPARREPLLKSPLVEPILQSIDQSGADPEAESPFEAALAAHPDDLALQQQQLHWIDHPLRRKKHLAEVEQLAGKLESALATLADTSDNRLLREHLLYRRARALAYRELPDVVLETPIEDPDKLNTRIADAYQQLLKMTGDEKRTEFILLDIRMLRRAGKQGQALQLLEAYGHTIQQKWYLKKRRDLLRELDWRHPFLEAAKIFADHFPEEIAKEKALQEKQQRLKDKGN